MSGQNRAPGVVLEDITVAGRDGDQDCINARITLSSLFAMCCNRVADRVGAGSIVDRCSRPEILSLCSCCHRRRAPSAGRRRGSGGAYLIFHYGGGDSATGCTLSTGGAVGCDRVADRIRAGRVVDRCPRPKELSLCSCGNRGAAPCACRDSGAGRSNLIFNCCR